MMINSQRQGFRWITSGSVLAGLAAGCAPSKPAMLPEVEMPRYISAATLAQRLGMSMVHETRTGAFIEDSAGNQLVVFPGKYSHTVLNGKSVGAAGAAIFEKEEVYVLASREQEVRQALAMRGWRKPSPPPPPVVRKPAPVRATIVIDPGHGGKDPGAKKLSARPEKEIVLNIAREVSRLLKDQGIRVVMTRSNDRFVELDDRAAIAERVHADLFVSIHADSAARSSASGATIYVARNASGSSVRAAAAINSALTSAGLETRGVKRAGFRVLVGHSRPAVLVECGYLSNRSDANRLSKPAEQMKVARVIANGIRTYFTRWRPLAKR